MAQKQYVPPELGPTNAQKDSLPLSESDGTVLVRFYFQGTDVPEGIPMREKRDAFPTSRTGVRQDTGTTVMDRSGVNAQFLRLGLANADGHSWKLVSLAQWPKEITDHRMRKRMIAEGREPIQTVVQLVYKAYPDEATGRGAIVLSREVRDTLTILSRQYAWTMRVWHNDAGPITVNLSSPSEEDPTATIVVRDGVLKLMPVEVKTVA